MNLLYYFLIEISAGDSEIPAGMNGAYVPCYSAAPDYMAAVKKGVQAVTETGYRFVNIKGDVSEISTEAWDEHVAETWPEFRDKMPSSDVLAEIVSEGSVIFGPFLGFTR